MMKKPVIVIGGGGHARVLLDLLKLKSIPVVGVSDPNLSEGNLKPYHTTNIIRDENILDFNRDEVELVNGIGSIKVEGKRRLVYERFKAAGFSFPSLIHPSIVMAEDIEIGEGTQVMAGAVLQTGSVIGENTIVNTRASIDHDCRIGSHVHLAPGVTLSGGVCVGSGSHVGTGTVVTQGVYIPENSFIKAGSIVTSTGLKQSEIVFEKDLEVRHSLK